MQYFFNKEERYIGGTLVIGFLIGLVCGYYFGQIYAWGQCAELCEAMVNGCK